MSNKNKRQKQLLDISIAAKAEIVPFDPNDLERLKDIGTTLYWAEGGKRHKKVDITNSDPQIIRIGMHWLRVICKVPEHRFKATIYYHAGQNEEEIKQYWSTVTGIPLTQFGKSIFKKEGTGHRKRILYYGTCKVVVCDADLLHRILTWIKQLHLPS